MEYPLKSQLYIRKNASDIEGVFTRSRIGKGNIILKCPGRIINHPNRYSLQIDEYRHLDKGGEIDDFINHACNPNCFIDFFNLTLVALRDIRADEELTINYCSSELKIEEPFVCNCGAQNCYKMVRGFAFLNNDEKNTLRETLSPFLKSIFDSTKKAQQ